MAVKEKYAALVDRVLMLMEPRAPVALCEDDCRRGASGWTYPPGQQRRYACGRHLRAADRAGITTEYWVD